MARLARRCIRSGLAHVLPMAVCVSLQAPANLAAQAVPDDRRITLERTGCAGECPVYTVSIDAHGTVTFEGKAHVLAPGVRTRSVADAQVRALLDEAERTGLFTRTDEAPLSPVRRDASSTVVIDAPQATISLFREGSMRRVRLSGDPRPEIAALANRIDAVAQTRPWLRLDVATLDEWVREHQRPPSRELLAHLRTALEYDDLDVIRALLKLGADPNGVDPARGAPLLLLAGSPEATRLLLAAGANPQATSETGVTPLWRATFADSAIAQLLLNAGVPVDQPVDEDGRTALWHAACRGNIEVVRLLLTQGASPAATSDGISALTCARESQLHEQEERALRLPGRLPFTQDFDGTIRLLQQALAGQARR